ncbi:MAG: thiamine phosphate synthase [Wohlfahrtiimonas sp.]
MIDWHKALRLYFIAGTQDVVNQEQLEDVLEEAIALGITCFQYREKGQGSLQNPEDRLAMAKRLQLRCKSASIPFIINDDVDLAIKIGADAIHVGQSDKPIAETIALAKLHNMDVGLSVNTIEQLKIASTVDGLDYVGVGPIFPTTSKNDAEPAIGVDGLAERIAQYPNIPKVAIGGINVKNSAEVLQTKVEGIAVISAITASQHRDRDIQILLTND